MTDLLRSGYGWREAEFFPLDFFDPNIAFDPWYGTGEVEQGIMVYLGGTFYEKAVKYFDGTTWSKKPLKFWDATAAAWRYIGEPPPGGGTQVQFGNTSLPGGSTTNLPGSDGRIFLTQFTVVSSGTLDFISIYSPVSGAGLIKGVLYADNAGVPGALVAVGTAVNTATVGWHVSTCAGEALSPGLYWLGAINFDFQSAQFCSASNGVNGWAQYGDSNYASPENPLVSGGAFDYDIAVFAEYTTP